MGQQKTEFYTAKEKKDITKEYRAVLTLCKNRTPEDDILIRKAFNVAMEAHQEMRRKSGEPYIYHPIAVAKICVEEIGLGATSVICALLHDVVEDTHITLGDIEAMFGKRVALIIDGLTKISGVSDVKISMQAENFRKMLLTLSVDVRVMLIKLADRLHNMRTLGSMRRDKQLKIASETLFLYTPLAHRLGLYAIKSDLENLAFKYKEPEIYEEISAKLKKNEEVRKRFISKFSLPIKRELEKQGYDFIIKGRPKSVISIYEKMKKQDIPFEEVYDLFAIRIIINSKDLEHEKSDCWNAYSVVTDFYRPNPNRLRDWVSTPKSNGYESLHTTVMSPTGKWVEVQIRTSRMDDVAERGFAAHWKYKGLSQEESGLDRWLNEIREAIENAEDNALAFVEDFKMNLFTKEIFVFTPTGELRMLPMNGTVLDMAFDIHTEVGSQCIGAKVNHKLVSLGHPLKNGDQVDIITSEKQNPKEEWLNFVTTHKAKNKIRQQLRDRRKKFSGTGKEILIQFFRKNKIENTNENIHSLLYNLNLESDSDLFYRLAKQSITAEHLHPFIGERNNIKIVRHKKENNDQTLFEKLKSKKEKFLIGPHSLGKYSLAECCSPISGDNVFGIALDNKKIVIHRTSCPNSNTLMAKYGDRVLRAGWENQENIEYVTKIRFNGIDELGLVNRITNIISSDLTINMQSISFESSEGLFNGQVSVLVYDTTHLDTLIENLKNIKGVLTVERFDNI